MTGPFADLLIAAGVLVGLWSLVQLIVNRPLGRALRLGVWCLEALIAVFLIGGIAQMMTTDQEFAKLEFVGYLLGMLAIPLAALWWTRTDGTRAGTAIIMVIGLVTSILVLRVQQVWAGPHG
ncbi:MAG: hypothetical protein WCG77_08475 [Actinomycetes bacterium]